MRLLFLLLALLACSRSRRTNRATAISRWPPKAAPRRAVGHRAARPRVCDRPGRRRRRRHHLGRAARASSRRSRPMRSRVSSSARLPDQAGRAARRQAHRRCLRRAAVHGGTARGLPKHLELEYSPVRGSRPARIAACCAAHSASRRSPACSARISPELSPRSLEAALAPRAVPRLRCAKASGTSGSASTTSCSCCRCCCRRCWCGAGASAPAFWIVEVLKVVTAFTVAHSITLALAALGVVSLPSRLVESAIAASVVLAALNNLWPVVQRGRWLVAFGFGLIHGFGFASVLADLGPAAGAPAAGAGGLQPRRRGWASCASSPRSCRSRTAAAYLDVPARDVGRRFGADRGYRGALDGRAGVRLGTRSAVVVLI